MKIINFTTLSPQVLNFSQPTSLEAQNTEGNLTKAFKALAYAIILVVAVIGNSFLILAYRRNVTGQMRSVYNLLVASIAASDLLLAIWSIPERITRVLKDDGWILAGVIGITLCKIVNFVEKVSITVSFLHLGALAIDRFLAVFYPCKSMVSIKSSKITVALIWGFSVCYWAPILYFGNLGEGKGQMYCAVRKFTPNWQYWYILFLILLFTTLVVIFILYLLVAFKLWLRKLPGNQMSSVNKRIDRSKRRMARMVSIIVMAFYICFLPYGIGWISCSYLVVKPKGICNPIYKFVSILVLHSNCSINPIICLLFNLQYRLEWKISLRDPFGIRVKAMRMSYRRRKSSTTTEFVMGVGPNNLRN